MGRAWSAINFGAGIQVYNNSEVTVSSTALDFRTRRHAENNGIINLNGANLICRITSAGNSFRGLIYNTATGTVHFNTHAQLEPGIVWTNNGTVHISPNNDFTDPGGAAGSRWILLD